MKIETDALRQVRIKQKLICGPTKPIEDIARDATEYFLKEKAVITLSGFDERLLLDYMTALMKTGYAIGYKDGQHL